MYKYWRVRAIAETVGVDSVGSRLTLVPGAVGWMKCAEAEQAARNGKVRILSPGGQDANPRPAWLEQKQEPEVVTDPPVEPDADIVPTPDSEDETETVKPKRGPQAKR